MPNFCTRLELCRAVRPGEGFGLGRRVGLHHGPPRITVAHRQSPRTRRFSRLAEVVAGVELLKAGCLGLTIYLANSAAVFFPSTTRMSRKWLHLPQACMWKYTEESVT